MSAVDVVYLKNVLLKFIAAQSSGKTQVPFIPWSISGTAAVHAGSHSIPSGPLCWG